MAHPIKCKTDRDRGRDRYAEGGGIPVVKIIPFGARTLPEPQARQYNAKVAPDYIKAPRGNPAPRLQEEPPEEKRGGKVKK